MTLLFSSKSNIREIILAVAKKSFEHGFNLGKFVLIYKAIIGLSVKGSSGSTGLLGRPSHPLHAMAAGAIGACVAKQAPNTLRFVIRAVLVLTLTAAVEVAGQPIYVVTM